VSVASLVNQRPIELVLPAEIARSWLTWQCQMVAGVVHGAIFTTHVDKDASKWLAS
jgi:hypothetical protein